MRLTIMALLCCMSGIIGGTRSGSIDPTLIFHHTPECSANVDENGQGLITKAELVLNKWVEQCPFVSSCRC